MAHKENAKKPGKRSNFGKTWLLQLLTNITRQETAMELHEALGLDRMTADLQRQAEAVEDAGGSEGEEARRCLTLFTTLQNAVQRFATLCSAPQRLLLPRRQGSTSLEWVLVRGARKAALAVSALNARWNIPANALNIKTAIGLCLANNPPVLPPSLPWLCRDVVWPVCTVRLLVPEEHTDFCTKQRRDKIEADCDVSVMPAGDDGVVYYARVRRLFQVIATIATTLHNVAQRCTTHFSVLSILPSSRDVRRRLNPPWSRNASPWPSWSTTPPLEQAANRLLLV